MRYFSLIDRIVKNLHSVFNFEKLSYEAFFSAIDFRKPFADVYFTKLNLPPRNVNETGFIQVIAGPNFNFMMSNRNVITILPLLSQGSYSRLKD